MRLWVDMDGVLADLEAGYEQAFGVRPSKVKDDVDWERVRAHGRFFETLPPMRDMGQLWSYIRPHNPTILSGVPKRLLGDGDTQKHRWALHQFGPGTGVVTCLASEKYLHCQPGDILIDDWEKYRHKWEKAGGIWVTHTDAPSTIVKLRKLGIW